MNEEPTDIQEDETQADVHTSGESEAPLNEQITSEAMAPNLKKIRKKKLNKRNN